MASLQKLPYYSFIFKNEAVAREWIPKLEAARDRIKPKGYKQTISKLMLMDYDQRFAADPEPQILAAGFENSEGDEISLDDIKKQMFQMSDGNLNFIAQCKCGDLRGNYHLNSICPKCGTRVRSAFANEVNFGGWLEIPNELPPLMHPVVYRVLRKWMGKMFKQSAYLLDAILDPSQKLPEPYAGKIGQGMSWLTTGTNFRDVINFVAQQRKNQKAWGNEIINEFLNQYSSCLFVRHIPMLNQSLHVMTQSGSMTYNDKSSEYIFKTYMELSSTIYARRHNSDMVGKRLDKRIWNVFSSWMKYVDAIIDPKLSGKTGFIRKNLLGARMHASCRAVITPITRNFDADRIEIPWRMIVGVMKLEILNILQNRYGKDINEAISLFNNALVTYIPIIDACLQTLLQECPFVGFPFLMGRNPTLRHGAEQLWFCSHYKTDPHDNTVGMSTYSISSPNADFDGDSLYLLSIKEMATVIDCMKLHPISTMLGGEGAELYPAVKMSSEMAIAWNEWMGDGVSKPLSEYKKAAGL